MKAIIGDSLSSENNIRKLGWRKQEKYRNCYSQGPKFFLSSCCCFLFTSFRAVISWHYLGRLKCSFNALRHECILSVNKHIDFVGIQPGFGLKNLEKTEVIGRNEY